MVLDQLIIAAMLSSAPIAHAPSQETYQLPARSYVEFNQPSEFEIRDAPPGARTDKFALERPKARVPYLK